MSRARASLSRHSSRPPAVADFDALLTMLDPEAVLRVDETAALFPASIQEAHAVAREMRGATAIARRAVGGGGAGGATLALVDGAVCGVVAPLGQPVLVLRSTIAHGKIVEIEAIADPLRLCQSEITLLEHPQRGGDREDAIAEMLRGDSTA
jgi:RNA polymerase sigma-70 factor, ECF subfamily